MKFFLIVSLFFIYGCAKPKTVLICGDHKCVNNAEAKQFFEENLSIEVKIENKKNEVKFDLVELNLNDNDNKIKKISIVQKKDTNKKIKILSNDEISKIKQKVKKNKKKKLLVKKKADSNSVGKIISNNRSKKKLRDNNKKKIEKIDNKAKVNVSDVCAIIVKCNIKEISKYLQEEGKKKGYPNISKKN
jgi:hypothetical protein